MDKMKCPYCGEEIAATAKKCKHCGEWLEKPDNGIISLCKNYRTKYNELVYKKWLDFKGSASKEDMKCMNINVFLWAIFICFLGEFLAAVTGDEQYVMEIFSHSAIFTIIFIVCILRGAVIPYISCLCRYLFGSSSNEAEA